MVTLTKTTRVLDHRPDLSPPPIPGQPQERPPLVRYTREPDDHTDQPTVVDIDWDTWAELGQPKQITVTIEPGDLLNTGSISET